jgi:hypothetical protein
MHLIVDEIEVAMPEVLLTGPEPAQLLRVSPLTMILWRYKKIGPAYIKLGSRSIRYSRRSIEKFLADKTITPGASNDVAAAVTASHADASTE